MGSEITNFDSMCDKAKALEFQQNFTKKLAEKGFTHVRLFVEHLLENGVEDGQYLVTAVKLPTGAIELSINNEHLMAKLEYIRDAYDDMMRLKANPEIQMVSLLFA